MRNEKKTMRVVDGSETLRPERCRASAAVAVAVLLRSAGVVRGALARREQERPCAAVGSRLSRTEEGLVAHPGVYAMVGSAGMLSGFTRMTIAVVVLLIEAPKRSLARASCFGILARSPGPLPPNTGPGAPSAEAAETVGCVFCIDPYCFGLNLGHGRRLPLQILSRPRLYMRVSSFRGPCLSMAHS